MPALVDRVTTEDGELRRLLAVRVADLAGWGGERAAARYIETIARVHASEQARLPGSTVVTEAVARGLHKLTAYKDEYEVARLHVEGARDLPARHEGQLPPPPAGAACARHAAQAASSGRWFLPVLRLLRHGRRLRGTALDPFGYAHVRRVERSLPGEYLALVDRALERLSPDTLATAIEIAELPELVRGYEAIKLAGVERFRTRGSRAARGARRDQGSRSHVRGLNGWSSSCPCRITP